MCHKFSTYYLNKQANSLCKACSAKKFGVEKLVIYFCTVTSADGWRFGRSVLGVVCIRHIGELLALGMAVPLKGMQIPGSAIPSAVFREYMVPVVQLAEHRIVVPKVMGSSPVRHPKITPLFHLKGWTCAVG